MKRSSPTFIKYLFPEYDREQHSILVAALVKEYYSIYTGDFKEAQRAKDIFISTLYKFKENTEKAKLYQKKISPIARYFFGRGNDYPTPYTPPPGA